MRTAASNVIMVSSAVVITNFSAATFHFVLLANWQQDDEGVGIIAGVSFLRTLLSSRSRYIANTVFGRLKWLTIRQPSTGDAGLSFANLGQCKAACTTVARRYP